MLLCMRCSETLETLHETEIAFQMRLSDDELAKTKELFLSKGFIDEQWNFTNWEKRQYASDSSTVRVRRHRDKKKDEPKQDETLLKRPCNGTEQNRTEQKQTKTFESYDSLFDVFWKAYPSKVGKDAARKAFAKRKPYDDLLALMLASLESQKSSDRWTKDNGQYIPNPATWLNQGRWMDEDSAESKSSLLAGGI